MNKNKFTRFGHVFTLLQKGDKCVVYQRSNKQGLIITYEVHKLRLKKRRIVCGISLPDTIRLASDEDFGKWAWSFLDLDKANEKFSKIENSSSFGNRHSLNFVTSQ